MNTKAIKAVSELRQLDHSFVGKQGVAKFAKAFNVSLKARRHYADPPGTFKGLSFNDGSASAMGLDAAEMAESICAQLGVDHPAMMGRGFRLRVCCDALEKYFNTNPA